MLPTILSHGKIPLFKQFTLAQSGKKNKKTYEDYFNFLESAAEKNGAEAFGFKLISDHAYQHPGILELLKERGYVLLHLIRKNFVRQYISLLRAKKSGVWAKKKSQIDGPALYMDPDAFERNVDYFQRELRDERRKVAVAGFKTREVFYESYLADPESFFRDIFTFLEVDYSAPDPSDLTITTPDDLTKVISNYDAIMTRARKISVDFLLENNPLVGREKNMLSESQTNELVDEAVKILVQKEVIKKSQAQESKERLANVFYGMERRVSELGLENYRLRKENEMLLNQKGLDVKMLKESGLDQMTLDYLNLKNDYEALKAENNKLRGLANIKLKILIRNFLIKITVKLARLFKR